MVGNASEGVIHWCYTGKRFGGQLVVCNCFLCRVLMHGCCQVWLWLTEINSVVLTCCMLFRSTVFMDVSCIPAEDSPIPSFKVVRCWETWETCDYKCFIQVKNEVVIP